MNFPRLLLNYLFSSIVFLMLDLLWLGVIASDLYESNIGFIMAESTNWAAALIFYLIYIAGILHFAVIPAVQKESLIKAVVNGALLGFLCYATFELTALAVLKDWPLAIVFYDILWGIFLTSSVSLVSFLFFTRIQPK